jgi:hypothetical protein
MTFEKIVDQAIAMLQRRNRVAYRTLKRQFHLDDEALEDLKTEIIKAQRLAVDEDGDVLVWTGGTTNPELPAGEQALAPLVYTPAHLAEKILLSNSNAPTHHRALLVRHFRIIVPLHRCDVSGRGHVLIRTRPQAGEQYKL